VNIEETRKRQLNKELSDFFKKSRSDAKRSSCYICNKPVSSFCNSHLIPRFILKNIAADGELVQPAALLNVPFLDQTKGLNNSGTFHIICKDCDSGVFSDYENPELIKKYPTNKLLAQIALKNFLMQINKRLQEKAFYGNLHKRFPQRFIGTEVLDDIQRLDLRDFEHEYGRAKKILDDNATHGYKLIFWRILPWRVPIAVQTPIVLNKNVDKKTLVDIDDFSESVAMLSIHLCAFPLKEEQTAVILFYHQEDTIYAKFEKQFQGLPEARKLEFINYLIFRYTENFYISKSARDLLKNQNLIRLFKEGWQLEEFDPSPCKPIKPSDIPNLLNAQHAIK